MKQSLEHIHHADDGRGHRKAFIDGREIPEAIYADTKRGYVVSAMLPLRVDKHKKRVLTKRTWGKVEIVFV